MAWHTIDFIFPYLLDGKTAAEFTARCGVAITPGRAARTTVWPGEPALDPEVVDFGEITIEVGTYDSAATRWMPSFAKPDAALGDKIRTWLEEPAQLDMLIEKAGRAG